MYGVGSIPKVSFSISRWVLGLTSSHELDISDLENPAGLTCARVGKQPNKPYSGQFRLRLSPDLHARVAIAAESKGKSLNTLITDLIERAI